MSDAKRRQRSAHVPAKWMPVRRQEHAPIKESGACSDSTGTEHALGDNGGPPLDEYVPEWGVGIGNYFEWRAAHRAAWRSLPHELMLWRLERAERVGLTYEEYTLEIIERGRYLGPDDTARVASIIQARRRKPSDRQP